MVGEGNSSGVTSSGVGGPAQDSASAIRLVTAPMAPPGWFFLKTALLRSMCMRSETVKASMSPIAIWTVVDVVGAPIPNETSSGSCRGEGSRMPPSWALRRGQSAGWRWDVIATTERSGERCGMRLRSSGVLPLKDTKRRTSFCWKDCVSRVVRNHCPSAVSEFGRWPVKNQ